LERDRSVAVDLAVHARLTHRIGAFSDARTRYIQPQRSDRAHYRRQPRHRPIACPGVGRAGATVAATARSREDAETTAAELRDLGIDAAGFTLDVTDSARSSRAIDAVVEHYGRLDVLVNNAGISLPATSLETPESDFRKVLTSTSMACGAARRRGETHGSGR